MNQATVTQNIEVLSKRWQCHIEWLREFAHGSRANTQPFKDSTPGWVCEGIKNAIELNQLVRHIPNYSAN
jgi:hypothetical protein